MKTETVFSLMRKPLLMLLLLTAAATQAYSQTEPPRSPGADSLKPMRGQKKIRVLELQGTAYQRGLVHGTELKDEIGVVIRDFKSYVAEVSGQDAAAFLKSFLAYGEFETATRKYFPEILDEVRGIADGSGQAYADILAFQLIDEFWVYLDKMQHEAPGQHCSTVGVPAFRNRPAFIAQNMDVPAFFDGHQVLLHIFPKKGPEQYVLTCAGLVALNGLNEEGIGVCVNTLMDLNARPDGLPVAFMIRAVLNQTKGSKALNFLQSVPHASGQNYILGTADSVYCLEASANQVVRYLPNGKRNAISYHTNHSIVNPDIKPWHSQQHSRLLDGSADPSSTAARFSSLRDNLNLNLSQISEDVVKSTLRNGENAQFPVCKPWREGAGSYTFSSVVFTLGIEPEVQLTVGPPDAVEYEYYYFLPTKPMVKLPLMYKRATKPGKFKP